MIKIGHIESEQTVFRIKRTYRRLRSWLPYVISKEEVEGKLRRHLERFFLGNNHPRGEG